MSRSSRNISLGLPSMPRRIPDYALQFADGIWFQVVVHFFGFSQTLFLFIVIQTIQGERQQLRPCMEGAHGPGVDVPSAPCHTFDAAERHVGNTRLI